MFSKSGCLCIPAMSKRVSLSLIASSTGVITACTRLSAEGYDGKLCSELVWAVLEIISGYCTMLGTDGGLEGTADLVCGMLEATMGEPSCLLVWNWLLTTCSLIESIMLHISPVPILLVGFTLIMALSSARV